LSSKHSPKLTQSNIKCAVSIIFNPFFFEHSSNPPKIQVLIGKSSFVLVKPLAMMVAEAVSLQSRLHQQVEAAALGEGSEGMEDGCPQVDVVKPMP
jgi:hypothetical protein